MKRIVIVIILLSTLLPLSARTKRSKVAASPTLTLAEQRKFDYYFQAGVKARQMGHLDEALELFHHSLYIGGNNAALFYELGYIYTVLEQYTLGFFYINLANNMDEDNEVYQQYLLSYYAMLGKSDQELALCKRMSEAHPSRTSYISYLAECYKRAGKWKEALRQYDRWEQIDGVQEDINKKKVEVLLEYRPKKVEKEIRKLVDAYPENTNYKIYLANYYVESQQYDKAEDIYKQILAQSPTDGYAINQLTHLYQLLGSEAREDSLLWTAVRNEGLLMKDRVRFAFILGRDSVDENVDSALQIIKVKNDGDIDFQEAYAGYLAGRGDTLNAIDYAERVVAVEPGREGAWIVLTMLATEANGVEVYSRAFESTKDSYYGFVLTSLLYTEGKKQDAYECVKHAIKGEVKSREAYATLWQLRGDIAHELGLKEEGYLAYDTCLMYNPKEVYALNNYAYFLALDTIDLKRAEEMSAKSIELDPTNATALGTYAWILYLRSDYTSAKFYMEKALSYDKNHEFILYAQYGDILLKKEMIEEAVKAWRQAIEYYKEGNDDASETREGVMNKIKQYTNEK